MNQDLKKATEENDALRAENTRLKQRITPREWNSAGMFYDVGSKEAYADAVVSIMAAREKQASASAEETPCPES